MSTQGQILAHPWWCGTRGGERILRAGPRVTCRAATRKPRHRWVRRFRVSWHHAEAPAGQGRCGTGRPAAATAKRYGGGCRRPRRADLIEIDGTRQIRPGAIRGTAPRLDLPRSSTHPAWQARRIPGRCPDTTSWSPTPTRLPATTPSLHANAGRVPHHVDLAAQLHPSSNEHRVFGRDGLVRGPTPIRLSAGTPRFFSRLSRRRAAPRFAEPGAGA